MAELIEAQGKSFWFKCKGAAVIITAVTGLVLGVLNHFREVRDPRVKASYQELSQQLELVSKDVKNVAATVQNQQQEIQVLMQYILRYKAPLNEPEAKDVIKKLFEKKMKATAPPAPPVRKAPSLEQAVQNQELKGS